MVEQNILQTGTSVLLTLTDPLKAEKKKITTRGFVQRRVIYQHTTVVVRMIHRIGAYACPLISLYAHVGTTATNYLPTARHGGVVLAPHASHCLALI